MAVPTSKEDKQDSELYQKENAHKAAMKMYHVARRHANEIDFHVGDHAF